MINKSEQFKEEDKARRELVDLKNEADGIIHNTDKSLSEHRSKLGQTDIEEIERDLNALRSLMGEDLNANDVTRVKEAIETCK